MAASSIASNAGPPTGAPGAVANANWLYGRGWDLVFGAGLGYILTIPLLVTLFASGRMPAWGATLSLALALLISGPHYGATLVRVYERSSDRHKYELFAVYITLGLVALLGLGMQSVFVGSLLITAYVTWSPWHFAGQNYGIALMFLRRRGVEIDPGFKRWFYASFVLSWVLAILSIHREHASLVFAQGVAAHGDYGILRAGIPMAWAGWLSTIAAVAYLSSLVIAARIVLRSASPGALVAPGLLVATQSLWFVLPSVGATTHAYQLAGLAFAPIWISTAHSIQYLWITSFYARRSAPQVAFLPFLTKALLAGAVLTILPKILVAPGAIGSYLTYAGVGALLFSVVNLHHFILDGAVWKLRDGRVASALLRSGAGETAEPIDAIGRRPLRTLVWAVGAGCLAVLVGAGVAEWASRSHSLPLAQVERANRSLAWLGRDHPRGWLTVASRYEQLGLMDPAIDAYRKGLEALRDRLDELPAPEFTNKLALLLLTHQRSLEASVREARELARYAVRADPGNLDAFRLLADAHLVAGDHALAERAARRAVELARAKGDDTRARDLERWIDDRLGAGS